MITAARDRFKDEHGGYNIPVQTAGHMMIAASILALSDEVTEAIRGLRGEVKKSAEA
jgi:hypothetical protein